MDLSSPPRVTPTKPDYSVNTSSAAGRLRSATGLPFFAPRMRRHPDVVSTPPLNRGHMVPRPWTGFWKSIGLGLNNLMRRPGETVDEVQVAGPDAVNEDWQTAAARRRFIFIMLSLVSSLLATRYFASVLPDHGNVVLNTLQVLLFAVLSFWVVTGFITGLMGFWVVLFGDKHALSAKQVANDTLNPDARTAIIMPICNEDVTTVFAGLRATCESVAATGHGGVFDVFILSDSNSPEQIASERAAWADLRDALAAIRFETQVRVFYRVRKYRTHRKAGNVADFCRRWGHDYRYMIVFDADSVMSGDCIVTLTKLMEANPRAGIIQTQSQGVGHITLHARAQQFASKVTGQLFTLGMQFWQLGEAHYFGHNAIIRIEPFMQHCALAPIEGKGGFAGGIMSHDFVEAALMRRAGYHVWLVGDTGGSYEQQPPDLLAELQRDRRWCQGNLQNSRLLVEPGLQGIHRAMFVTGTLSYVSAPLWLAFILAGTVSWLWNAMNPGADTMLPYAMAYLWQWTLCILFMPRVLGVLSIFIRGQQHTFGGGFALLKSAVLEAVLAILQAPIRMAAHSLFVIAALTNLKLEWKSPPRHATEVPWRVAYRQFASMSIAAVVLLAVVALIDTGALLWLLPVALPLALAVPLAVTTSQLGLGQWARARALLLIPDESGSPKVLRRAELHASRLSALPNLA